MLEQRTKEISMKTEMSRPQRCATIAFVAFAFAFVATASLSYRLGQLTSIFADLGPSAREGTKKQTKKERRKLNLIEFGLSRTLSSTTSPVSPTATVFSISYLTTSCLWLLWPLNDR